MLNARIGTRGGPSSTWMLSVLLQLPFRASIQLPGAIHGTVGHTAALCPRAGGAHLPGLPHCALEYFETSASVAWIWGTGEVGLWRGGGSRELPRRPSSLRMPHPSPCVGKRGGTGILAAGTCTVPPVPSLCLCQSKVNLHQNS